MNRSAPASSGDAMSGRETAGGSLPCFAQWRSRLLAAERRDGWLDQCDNAGRFLAVNQDLVNALAATLRRLSARDPVLEVCAGGGELARGLNSSGVCVHATDAEPPSGSDVQRIAARPALRRFQGAVVLGAFVPIDAGVDEAVMACPSVRHYVVLNARIGGSIGSATLWRMTGWKARSLDVIRRWMITRHDVWLRAVGSQCRRPGHLSGEEQQAGDILQHGEAWHFSRV